MVGKVRMQSEVHCYLPAIVTMIQRHSLSHSRYSLLGLLVSPSSFTERVFLGVFHERDEPSIGGRKERKSVSFALFPYFPICGFFFFFFFCLFRAVPLAYGGSQARGWTGVVAADLFDSHSNTRSQPCLWPIYTTGHGNTRSLTLWVMPGIKLASSWMVIRFLSAESWRELLTFELFIYFQVTLFGSLALL